MDWLVFAAVLCAAAAHAGWNAAIKREADPFVTTVMISLGAGLVALALVPATGLPAPAAWPWVIASVVIHLVYFVGLIEAYGAGDMGQVYPIARGAAPLMTAVVSTTWLGETLAPAAWFGLVLLIGGVLLLSLRGGQEAGRLDRRAVGFALLTAVTVCSYSVVDGVGARVSGNPGGYAVVLFAGIGVVMVAYSVLVRGPRRLAGAGRYWRKAAIGGALLFGSYGVALWAMTKAPIAVVAALRETSVLFGALIAVVVLKEPLRASRIAAAMMIVAGLVLIRLP